jgi:16S rRNA (cytidine1402-2'-O)-methyltransferase
MIFYESVHRIKETLENMLEVFGNRNICVCRELSKIHEEFTRGTIEEIIPLTDTMKGEFVIVVEGNKEIVDYSSIDMFDHVKMYVEDGMSEKDAIKLVAKERDVPKSEVYSYYHNRK